LLLVTEASIGRNRLSPMSPIALDVTVPRGLSVCHVRALCSNGRRYRHVFFCILHTTFPCHSQMALKFGLHRSTPSSANFAPEWPTPYWFESSERRRHSITNCGRMVRDSAKVTMQSL